MSLVLPPYDPAALPVVLTGPILRRLTRHQVSVWVALSLPAAFTLHVRRKGDTSANTVTVTPERIGRHLYVAVATVDGLDGPNNDEFAAGNLYEYWLESANWPTDPGRAPNWADYVLPTETLPTFLGLPAVMSDFIVFHGSCRRAKGDRRDGMAQGYRLMVNEPAQRPHIMILSGDQIYADEVGCVHMLTIRRIAEDLIAIDEYGEWPNNPGILAVNPNEYPTITGTAIPKIAGRSQRCLDIGFSVGGKDHLWTLAEYYGMYLTVWSDVLWPDPLPAFDANAPDLVKYRDKAAGIKYGTDEDYWLWEDHNLNNFLDTMGVVKRMLANIPTYMLFDDHEATDDWNLDYSWIKDVYRTSPPAQRIITNALLSYLIFQHWGNVPAAFQALNAPARKCLDAAQWQATAGFHPVARAGVLFSDPDALLDLLGVPLDVPSLLDFDEQNGYDLRSNLDPNQVVRYDFRLDPGADGYPCHLVFLDERTARHFGGTSVKVRCGRVGAANLDLMWPPPQGDQADLPTILIAPAPVLGLHAAEHMLQPLLATVEEDGERKREYEGWSAYLPSFEHLLVRISQWKRVIILSGDVHFGYTHKLTYENPVGSLPTVAAQFVASSMKYSMANTRKIHVVGDFAQKIGGIRDRTYYGYAQLTQEQIDLVHNPPVAGSALSWDAMADLVLGRVLRHSHKAPVVLQDDIALAYANTDGGSGLPNGFESPDWTYTVEVVSDERTAPIGGTLGAAIDAAAAVDFGWEGWNAAKSATMVRALRASDLHQIGRVITGLPIFSRITFQQNGSLSATQEMFLLAGNDEAGGMELTTLTTVDLGA